MVPLPFLIFCLIQFQLGFLTSGSLGCPEIRKPKSLIAEGDEGLAKFFEKGEKDPCRVDEVVVLDIIKGFPSKRFFSLLEKTTNLKFLTIENCTIPDKDLPSTRIKFQNLTQVYLDMNCEKTYTQDEFSRALFFDNGQPWKLEDIITSLKIDIDVSCKEEPHFSYNVADKWLQSEYSFTNELLKNAVNVDLKSVDLVDCELNVDLLPSKLRLLELVDVVMKNGNLMTVMKKCSSLTDIAFSYVKTTNPPAMDKETGDFLNQIGVKNQTSFWIAKNDGKWAPGIVRRKKKKAAKKN